MKPAYGVVCVYLTLMFIDWSTSIYQFLFKKGPDVGQFSGSTVLYS